MERKAFSFQVCRARPNPQRSPIRNVNPPKAQIARTRPTTYAKRPHTSSNGRGMLLKIASNQVTTVVIGDHGASRGMHILVVRGDQEEPGRRATRMAATNWWGIQGSGPRLNCYHETCSDHHLPTVPADRGATIPSRCAHL